MPADLKKNEKSFIMCGNRIPVAMAHVQHFQLAGNIIRFHFENGGLVTWDFGTVSEAQFVNEQLVSEYVARVQTRAEFDARKARKKLDETAEKSALEG